MTVVGTDFNQPLGQLTGSGDLTGFLADGTPLDVRFVASDAGVITLVPPECADGIDNDLDGLIDAAQDPGCSGPGDTSEQEATLPCDDGLDNDGDSLIDLQDPVCVDPAWPTENAQCQDGVDNDGDGHVDFDGGTSFLGDDIAPPDPQCSSFSDNREAPRCGLGPELALILPLLALAHRRRQKR